MPTGYCSVGPETTLSSAGSTLTQVTGGVAVAFVRRKNDLIYSVTKVVVEN